MAFLHHSLEQRGKGALYISTDNHQGGWLLLADLLRWTPETPSGGRAALIRYHCNLLKIIFKRYTVGKNLNHAFTLLKQ